MDPFKTITVVAPVAVQSPSSNGVGRSRGLSHTGGIQLLAQPCQLLDPTFMLLGAGTPWCKVQPNSLVNR